MGKVLPQTIEACNQKELLSTKAFQELEWHVIDDVDFDGVENDISEISQGPEPRKDLNLARTFRDLARTSQYRACLDRCIKLDKCT